MMFYKISTDKDSLYQSISTTLNIGSITRRVSFELKYWEKTDRWYVSLYDLQTEEIYCMNVPLLSSTGDIANNLFEPFFHKNIGMLFCFPASENVTTENPSKDNLTDFLVIWSDGIV